MMCNADEHTVAFTTGMADITHDLATLNPYNFVVYGQKHKVWVLVFLVRTRGTR